MCDELLGFGWFCEVKLKLVVAGSRPSVFCLLLSKSTGLPWGCPAAGVGPSWVGGTRGMPSGEIWRENGVARGVSIGLTKSPCRKLFPKFRQKIRCQFFLDFFLFYRVFGCFSAMGVQKHYKKRFTKKIVSKSFYKKFYQKSKTDFFSIFF